MRERDTLECSESISVIKDVEGRGQNVFTYNMPIYVLNIVSLADTLWVRSLTWASQSPIIIKILQNGKYTIYYIMNVKTIDSHSKYLRLLVVFGRSKKAIFSLVNELI